MCLGGLRGEGAAKKEDDKENIVHGLLCATALSIHLRLLKEPLLMMVWGRHGASGKWAD